MKEPDFSPTVSELLRDCVARSADEPLIVHGDRRLSYRDVERQSAKLAKGLLARGVARERASRSGCQTDPTG